MNQTLTALKGVKVGHSTHLDKLTGCTLIMFDHFTPVTYSSHGGAPGLFNDINMQSGKTFHDYNGIFISGGSLEGLILSSEIMQCMIENKIGAVEPKIVNPVLTGAIVFDLGTSIDHIDPKYGREAFENLSTDPVERGNVGAGTGTRVGTFYYLEKGTKPAAMKSGVGCAKVDVGGGAFVTALSVVNALGNIVKPDGTILAGNRNEDGGFKYFTDTTDKVTNSRSNTTISIVGTNVKLKSYEDYQRIANVATHGQVRAINPVNTGIDGDTVFVFSTEEIDSFMNETGKYFETPGWPTFSTDLIAQAAAKVVQDSIYDACEQAISIEFKDAYKGIIPSSKDY